jgi:hypothetical protein
MNFSFARDSIAYDRLGLSYAVDTPLTRTITRQTGLVVSRPTGEGTGGEDVVPVAGISGRVWGSNAARTHIYVNTDGTWTDTGLTVTADNYFFATTGDCLLYLSPSGDEYTVHRVSWNGAAWVDAVSTIDGDDFTMAWVWEMQGISQSSGGTIIFGEYGTG